VDERDDEGAGPVRWATYVSLADGTERVGLVDDGRILGLAAGPGLIDLLGDDGSRLREAAEGARTSPAEVVDLEAAELRAAVPDPPSVRDFASFEAHLRVGYKSAGLEYEPEIWFSEPKFYFTNPYAQIGHGAVVSIAPGSEALDYELELAAVVGQAGTNLSTAEAADAIAGYVIFNDWSARDLQVDEMKTRMGQGKSKDWAISNGPVLVTKDELEPYRKGRGFDLQMRAYVNGKLYSEGNAADAHWSFEEMVAHASRGTWVKPGDLIASGTVGSGCIIELAGVHGADQYPWLKVGDEVVLEVEGIGRLVNTVGPAAPVVPLRPDQAVQSSRDRSVV
jgi:2-keto-4-pentenoate hydratase/2-oxohepta-3-ene-1,7-dioic acid hydratase in catechol pathway